MVLTDEAHPQRTVIQERGLQDLPTVLPQILCDEENPWNLLNCQTRIPSKEIFSRGLNIFNTQEVLIVKRIWKAQENDPVTTVVTIH